jgi:hypothetical protein
MIVFSHVPKTAGTSITSVIVEYLNLVHGPGRDDCLLYGREIPYDHLEPLEPVSPRVRFLSGHFRAPHYERLLAQTPFVFASFRDPFPRFCSGLEHVHRLITGGLPGKPEMLANGGRLLEALHRHRSDSRTILAAMREFRSVEVQPRGSRRILCHDGRLVAHARIESMELQRLCQKLAATTEDPAEALPRLMRVSKENIWPAGFFSTFTPTDMETLHGCFQECFADEVELGELFRRDVPSLFEDAPWARLLEGLLHGRSDLPLWSPPTIPDSLNAAA